MTTSKGDLVRQRLLALIEELPQGEQLPSERVLGERFGVARETLRRALDDLADDGLLVRRQGSGTFVARPKLTQTFRVQSFSEDMRARRMSSSSRLISHRSRAAGARMGARLQISPGDPVLTMRRLRLADGEPMALEDVTIPEALIPGFDPELLGNDSLYTTLSRRYGIEIASGSQTMEATVLDDEEAALLAVAPLSPAILVERVTWMQDGRRVEAVRSLYRGDRYQFQVDLDGSHRQRDSRQV